MRTVIIPPDVPWTDETTGQPLDARGQPTTPDQQEHIRFADIFLKNWLQDQKWGQKFETVLMRIDIAGHFKHAQDSKLPSFELTDSEWQQLCAIVREPSAPYPMVWAGRVPAFFEAILNAKPSPEEAKKG